MESNCKLPDGHVVIDKDVFYALHEIHGEYVKFDTNIYSRDVMPNENICFNPSKSEDIDSLLCKYGPEVVWDISQSLMKAVIQDCEIATKV